MPRTQDTSIPRCNPAITPLAATTLLVMLASRPREPLTLPVIRGADERIGDNGAGTHAYACT